jgi:glycogen operon protein
VKLIAEPWDVGEGGYQVGNFPPGWAEWNGRYRDDVRDYWRGEGGRLGELAYRLTGSSDLYQGDSRRPHASINFITAHDGFTCRDLVSYNEKHNEANGEDNRDGEDHNRSWNCGAEGDTDCPEILALRGRQQRNLLATLLLSQGVPMIVGGDELGRTQQGNNNAYCQDSPISWTDWQAPDAELLAFVRQLVAFRRAHPAFRRSRFFQGRPLRGSTITDVAWLSTDASEMTDEQWDEGHAKSLAVYLNGSSVDLDRRGEAIHDDSFLIFLNAHGEAVTFRVPDARFGEGWHRVIDTASTEAAEESDPLAPGAEVEVASHSLVVLQAPADRLRVPR